MTATVPVEQLGAELRRRRADLGVSLRAVEQQTNISAATLSRIERGSVPDLSVIERLAAWLNVIVHASGGAPAQGEHQVRTDDDLLRTIEIHLRANKHMSEDLARSIANTFDTLVKVEAAKAEAAQARTAAMNIVSPKHTGD